MVSLKVNLRPGASEQELNKALSFLNKLMDDADVLKDLAKHERWIKKSKLNAQYRFEKKKRIHIAQAKRAEVEAKVKKISPVK